MTIAASVQSYLNRDGVRYEMITHERTRTAITAHTPRTFRVANWRNASCCGTARDTRWPCFLPRTTESVPIDCLTGNEVRRAVAASPSGFREGVAA